MTLTPKTVNLTKSKPHPIRPICLFWWLVLSLPCLAGKPNIVIIVADDLGWADVGYHDAPFPTPNIDALCKAGAELDQFYVHPTCTPTRVALLTGRYASRFGNYAPNNDRVLPWDTVTLANALGGSGYHTMISGKWHLGSKPEFGPRKFGFERSYGSLAGGCGPYDHLYKGGKKVWHRNDEILDEQGHVTDLIADEAISFISEKRDKPFFLYLPFTAVHDPFDEPEKYLDQGKHIGEGRRQYAASAVHMDEAIGRFVDALKKQGVYDNTLLIFMSDNGGTRGENGSNYPGTYPFNNEQGSNRPLRGWKRSVHEGGVRVPAFAVWPGKIEPGATISHPLHAVDWMPTLSAIAGYKASTDLKWDGHDIGPLLTGRQTDAEPRTLYCVAHTRAASLRHGDWKLIVDKDRKNKELYNLSDDPHEKTNLASARPEIVERLLGLLEVEATKDEDALPK